MKNQEEINNSNKEIENKVNSLGKKYEISTYNFSYTSGGSWRRNSLITRVSVNIRQTLGDTLKTWVGIDEDGKWEEKLDKKLEVFAKEIKENKERVQEKEDRRVAALRNTKSQITEYGEQLVAAGIWKEPNPTHNYKPFNSPSIIDAEINKTTGDIILKISGKSFPVSKLTEVLEAEQKIKAILDTI